MDTFLVCMKIKLVGGISHGRIMDVTPVNNHVYIISMDTLSKKPNLAHIHPPVPEYWETRTSVYVKTNVATKDGTQVFCYEHLNPSKSRTCQRLFHEQKLRLWQADNMYSCV